MVSAEKVKTVQLPRGPHVPAQVVCESWNSANSCCAGERCWSITGSLQQYGALSRLYSDLGEMR